MQTKNIFLVKKVIEYTKPLDVNVRSKKNAQLLTVSAHQDRRYVLFPPLESNTRVIQRNKQHSPPNVQSERKAALELEVLSAS
ncbi:unnamed protein product [Arctia plantaginis]|uniref:Uncharacterized protein n=1 Tax=Arctia plantaginis TaxID=874455 RepID=A0A8S0Z0G7_ARCPL|nr:unnamed protein product [Arctia plantaginis]